MNCYFFIETKCFFYVIIPAKKARQNILWTSGHAIRTMRTRTENNKGQISTYDFLLKSILWYKQSFSNSLILVFFKINARFHIRTQTYTLHNVNDPLPCFECLKKKLNLWKPILKEGHGHTITK